VALGVLDVDGVSESALATFRTQVTGTTAFRATAGQTWRVTLASAGSHTLKLRASKTANTAGTLQVQSTHTTLSVQGNFD
jgi:hypothetical protein